MEIVVNPSAVIKRQKLVRSSEGAEVKVQVLLHFNDTNGLLLVPVYTLPPLTAVLHHE